jgi:hypothetical protein
VLRVSMSVLPVSVGVLKGSFSLQSWFLRPDRKRRCPIQEYVAAPEGDTFSPARVIPRGGGGLAGVVGCRRDCSTLSWKGSWMYGRELLRRLFQGRLDLLATREVRRHDVTGAEEIARTRTKQGRSQPLATKSGQITVTRIAYRARRTRTHWTPP